MKITVYHVNRLTKTERDRLNASDGGWDSEPRFSRYANITTGTGKFEANVRMALALGEYHKAAEVDTTNLDAAFELTNHITHDWAENERVTALVEQRKSSSVGDVFQRGNEFFIVDSYGFIKMTGFTADEIGSLSEYAA